MKNPINFQVINLPWKIEFWFSESDSTDKCSSWENMSRLILSGFTLFWIDLILFISHAIGWNEPSSFQNTRQVHLGPFIMEAFFVKILNGYMSFAIYRKIAIIDRVLNTFLQYLPPSLESVRFCLDYARNLKFEKNV